MLRWIALVLIATPLRAEPVALDPDVFETRPAAEVALGQLLFYDPILSGSRTVSCATCHHPKFATGDGVSLGLGDGGLGLGPDREIDADNPPEQRIPRNAPPLFNLGHPEIRVLFADGRVEVDADRAAGFRTPLEDEMVQGFDGILSAQTMFPVLSPDEMAGHYQENDVAKAVRQGRLTGDGGAWDIIARRVAKIPEYRARFEAVYPERDEIAFTDISNAIAAFMDDEWRATDSLYDRAARGEAVLPPAAAAGQTLFFADAGCATCHAGPLLSDQSFHAMGAPQIGPGKAERFERHVRDVGRMRVTGRTEDAYAFRTPMLRNVVETGPWGHAGGHDDLRAFVAHHADPVEVETPRVVLPGGSFDRDGGANADAVERRDILDAVTHRRALSEAELDALMAFLATLSDPVSLAGRSGIPATVPSGLPIDR